MAMSRQDWYLFSYRHRYAIGSIVLILCSLVMLFGSLLIWRAVSPDSLHKVLAIFEILRFDAYLSTVRMPYIAAAAAVLLILLYLSDRSCAIWYSAGVREVALRLARLIGRSQRWLRSGWRLGVLLFLAVAIGVEWWQSLVSQDSKVSATTQDGLLSRAFDLGKLFEAQRFSEVLLTMALIVIIVWAYRSRRRIAILAFDDYTNDEELKAGVEGAALALSTDLMSIVELYRTIDEASPPTADKAIESVVRVQGVGETLKGAISSDAKLSFGPNLQIPVGWIMANMGRLLQGATVSGSVHKEGGTLVIRANLSGGGLSGNWCVSLQDLANEATPADLPMALGAMIEQLACRISTDLVHIGSRRWRAVRHFTEGLCAYRDSRLSRSVRPRLKLLEAERAFMRALAEDLNFGQCHYNLGVVYRELHRSDSAEASFRLALRDDPGNYEAWYALALNYYYSKRCEDALWLCGQAIRLRPSEARAWDLKGLIQHEVETGRLDIQILRAEEHPERWASIIPPHEVAAAHAWRALCGMAMSGDRNDLELRDAARTCTRNAAVAKAMGGDGKTGARLMRQAVGLQPTDSDNHFELGMILVSLQAWQQAADAFDNAYEEALAGLKRPRLWVNLVVVHARLSATDNGLDRENHQVIMKEALDHFRDTVSGLDSRDIGALNNDISNAKNELILAGESKVADEIDNVLKLRSWLVTKHAAEDLQDLRAEVDKPQLWPDDDWAAAQVRIRLAEILLDSNQDLDQARKCLSEAIEQLNQRHRAQIREQGLYCRLARICLGSTPSLTEEALYNARLAVSINPERAQERGVLEEVYGSLCDYERAEAAWAARQSLELPDRRALGSIVRRYWNRGVSMRDRAARRESFQQVIEYIHRLLDHVDGEPPEGVKKEDLVIYQGWGNYWIGLFYRELLEYDRAIYHLQIAQKLDFKPLESCDSLGLAYLEVDAYEEAEAMYQKLFRLVREMRAEARRTTGKPLDLNKPLKGKMGADRSINEIRIMAAIGLAKVYAERSVRLSNARRLKQGAYGLAMELKKLKELIPGRLADIHGCAGLIALKSDHLSLARKELENAVIQRPDEEHYLNLAQAYWRTALANTSHRFKWLEKSREACELADELDLCGRYTAKVRQLLAKVDEAETPAAKP